MSLITIATRKSPLAIQQAEIIQTALYQHYPDIEIALLPMETTGDKILGGALAELGGKSLFVKELERALLDKKADFAVHSMKDVPTIQPKGLEIAVICQREDPRDVLISNRYAHITELPKGAKVGTASLRRQCQLYALYPHLNITMLRGNINTRLQRLADGDFDAIILAAAGLHRLGLTQHIRQYFSTQVLLPSAGQGALGIECRTEDQALKQLLSVLSDPVTRVCLEAERALTHRLGSGCRAPVAAFCEKIDQQLCLRGLVGSPDGSKIVHCIEKSDFADNTAEIKKLGIRAADVLLRQGAQDILNAL